MEDWLPWVSIAASVATAIIGLVAVRMVRTVHVMMNSRMDQLLTITAAGSRAEGAVQERAEADARKVVRDAVDKDIRDAGR